MFGFVDEIKQSTQRHIQVFSNGPVSLAINYSENYVINVHNYKYKKAFIFSMASDVEYAIW